jgi:hypothetical protein
LSPVKAAKLFSHHETRLFRTERPAFSRHRPPLI